MKKQVICVKVLAALVLVVISSMVIGCKKSCYNCKSLVATFKCYKNGDSVYLITYNQKNLQDTIGDYLNHGYACDTLGQSWIPAYVDNPICGKADHDDVLYTGDSCYSL